MASIRDIKRQIVSVQSTQKITSAMKMVSAAKMRRANDAMVATRPYAAKIREVAFSLASQAEEIEHPYMEAAEEVSTIALFVVNSDRGLCGSFNSGVTKLVLKFCQEHPGKQIKLFIAGKNAYNFFKKRDLKILKEWTDLGGKITYITAQNISDILANAFIEKEFDELYMIYNEFRSTAYQVPVSQKLLPLSFDSGEATGTADEEAAPLDYIFEPAPEKLLADLLPRYVAFSIYHVLLESAAGEHGARMVAMDNATRSAKEMIEKLTLYYNKARQAAITTDLLDILNGAEALK